MTLRQAAQVTVRKSYVWTIGYRALRQAPQVVFQKVSLTLAREVRSSRAANIKEAQELIPPTNVAWRADTTTLFLLGSFPFPIDCSPVLGY
jgi:hypothetical protein